MNKNFLARVQKYQDLTFRFKSSLRLKSAKEAIRFVEERGFVFFWPVKGTIMPSLWGAVAGDRPVPDEHDDPGHITWRWKDELLDQKVWYYARILRKRNTIVSLKTIPYFYALSANYGDPEAEIVEGYRQGLIPLEVKTIFNTLQVKGALDSITLRRESHLSGPQSNGPFNRALDFLQKEFKVLPVAVAEAGAWHYAFVYDLTHRYYPKLLEQSRTISEVVARNELLRLYLKSVGAASTRQIRSLFGWTEDDSVKTLMRLQDTGSIIFPLKIEGSDAATACLPDLVS